jgi:hypothetical protein
VAVTEVAVAAIAAGLAEKQQHLIQRNADF